MNPNEIDLTAMLVIVGLVLAMLFFRLLISRPIWRFHVDGTKGYLGDEVLRLSMVTLPAIVLGVFLSFFVQNQSSSESVIVLALGVVLVVTLSRFIPRYLPFLRKAQERILAARQHYFERSEV